MAERLSEKQLAIIHEWSKAQVESAAVPNYGKLMVTAPNLLRLVGEVEGKDVLELGCGNGYWLRLLRRAGARCAGVDHAENQIAAAKEWDDPFTSGIDYRVGDVSSNIDFRDKFDIAFFEHVLLEIPTIEGLHGAMKNAAGALHEGGRLVVSDLHPFAPVSHPDNIRISDDFSYFDSGASIEIMSKRIDGEIIYYKDCHWALGDITLAITEAGFVIEEIVEPTPSEEDVKQFPDELAYRLKYPMAIMIVARKVA